MRLFLTNYDLRALYSVAADFHGGQGSRGYRLLSRAYRLMVKRGMSPQDRTVMISKHPIYSRWADAVANCRGF